MMNRVELIGCEVASVKGDLVKDEVRIVLTAALDDQILDAKAALAEISKYSETVDVSIRPQHMQLPLIEAGSDDKPVADEETEFADQVGEFLEETAEELRAEGQDVQVHRLDGGAVLKEASRMAQAKGIDATFHPAARP